VGVAKKNLTYFEEEMELCGKEGEGEGGGRTKESRAAIPGSVCRSRGLNGTAMAT
jgi:hypothetical protein